MEQVAQEQVAQESKKLFTPALHAKIERRVRECLDIATKQWPQHKAKFQDAVTIRYDVKNRFGGLAISGGSEDWTIRLNLILCFENEEHFIKQTVGHEVAHLVNHVVHGFTKQVEEKGKMVTKKVRSHGKEWRHVMTVLGLEPKIYHTYDCSSIQTKPRRRARRGSVLTPTQTADMIRRLQTGFKRLDDDTKKVFMMWAQDRVDGVEEEA